MHDVGSGAQGWHDGATLTIRDLGRMIQTHYAVNGRKTGKRVATAFAHLEEFFHDIQPGEMGRRSRAYIAHRIHEGAAPATVRQELANLSTALGIAVHAGYLPFRPTIQSIAVNNVRRFTITEERCDALLAYLPTDLRDIAEMGYLTGWRVSEIVGLKWSNVDRVNKVIRLEPGTTKSGRGRVYPYGSFRLLERLIERRKRKGVETESRIGGTIAHVFHRNGVPIQTFYKSWRRACERAGIPGFWYHDLRRCAAQNLVRARVPIQTAMAVLGHATRSIFDRYAIVDEEDLRTGIEQYARRMSLARTRFNP